MSRSVVLVRHGLSQMNVALSKQPWGTPGFVDKNIRDAKLEPEGVRGAKALRDRLAREAADVELVVSCVERVASTHVVASTRSRGVDA